MADLDSIGQAVHDYHFKKDAQNVIVHAEGFDTDEIITQHFFRNYNQMPQLEQAAMDMCYGRVLDVGACAGCHSLYLQSKGLDVVALERSALSVEVLKDRGVKQVVHADLFDYDGQFDTILLLMNGSGIAGTLENFPRFIAQLKKLLKPGGQILMDSSDLIYLYENEDGSADINLAGAYYGELIFRTEYKGQMAPPFPWLYLDFKNLQECVQIGGLAVDAVKWGEHYDYLCTIKHAD